MTPLQSAVFDFVRDLSTEGQVVPSIREIGDQFGLRSTSTVKRVLDALVAQGRLIRTADKVRNLALPDGGGDLSRFGTGILQAELERRGQPFVRKRNLAQRTPTRPCAAAGCVERVTRGKIFCGGHWQALPVGLRRDLVEAFRAGHDGPYQDAYQRSLRYLSTKAVTE